MLKKIKVLVPLDFSRYSSETLRFTLTLAQSFELDLTLLHVIPSGEVESFAEMGRESNSRLERRRSEAEELLLAEEQRCRESVPGLAVTSRVATGIIFKEICRLADEENFSLIVIGTHGRTGLSHLLIGSTTERVVQHASCPVLSLKPRVV